jgi:hypothetical protein
MGSDPAGLTPCRAVSFQWGNSLGLAAVAVRQREYRVYALGSAPRRQGLTPFDALAGTLFL